jgi:uncharacterized protein involved in outer membrane biogenesis
MSIRRFFLISILTILLGSTILGGVYLYTFDLNSFRTEIETLASEKLARPLTLGKAHLSLKHGPAFAFDQVKIGTAEDDIFLTVDKLFFRVQALPLLSGKVLFSEILLENPDFTVRANRPKSKKTPNQTDQNLRFFSEDPIKSLRVINGKIHLSGINVHGQSEEIRIENLRFNIDDFSFVSAGSIKASATLIYRGVRSPFSLNGNYNPDQKTTTWLDTFYQVQLNIDNLSAKKLTDKLQTDQSDITLKGLFDLNLKAEGIPGKGVTFSSTLTGKNLNLLTTSPSPLVISAAQMDGFIQYKGDTLTLKDIRVSLETGPGHLESKHQIQATLSDNRVIRISSRGNISSTRSKSNSEPSPPFYDQSLATSYQAVFTRTEFGENSVQGDLLFPGIKLLFDSQWHDDEKYPFDLTFDVTDASTIAVTDLLPQFDQIKKLNLYGRFGAHLKLSGANGKITKTTGNLDLDDVHLAIPGPLADLSELNGSIQIDNQTITAKSLQANLGVSPITIDLTIPDFKSSDVTLHVLADSIRADALVFPSTKHYLRQVDGVVKLAENAVILGPIYVKMDGGTDATVSGTIRNFSAAEIDLDIKGRHGNIDEIIGLWSHDNDLPAPPPPEHKKHPGSLTIDIVTDSGQISGMPFEHATSQIVRRNKTLDIGPIHFKNGEGSGIGRVLIENQDDGHSKLKISGDLKDIDANAVYNQLLKRQGLVSGKLSGDFYLEGLSGKKFLPTSSGTFTVQIDDGRLHKLTGLSKILHVLNLYPLLTENVQGKGLPYKKITFNAKLAKGILSSEDFLMAGDIMNLSLTGQYNIIESKVDFDLAAMPLRSVDSILSRIPIAGWLLTGDQKSLVIAYFKMTGNAADPDVTSVPLDSVTTPVIGILKRVFSFPVKIVTDPGKAILNQ